MRYTENVFLDKGIDYNVLRETMLMENSAIQILVRKEGQPYEATVVLVSTDGVRHVKQTSGANGIVNFECAKGLYTIVAVDAKNSHCTSFAKVVVQNSAEMFTVDLPYSKESLEGSGKVRFEILTTNGGFIQPVPDVAVYCYTDATHQHLAVNIGGVNPVMSNAIGVALFDVDVSSQSDYYFVVYATVPIAYTATVEENKTVHIQCVLE